MKKEVSAMKRLLPLVVIFVLLASVAMAEGDTVILGHMPDDEYIHQYTAPNGQLLWFTAMEQNPYIKLEDVNFDGHEDIVIFVVCGASNFFTEFFIYDPAADVYVLAVHHDTEIGICNYQLHPELDIVESHANNGNAGLLHVTKLYRWEGNNLQLIRSAVSDEWAEDIFEGQTYTSIIHGDMLHITVRDHKELYDESVLWELIIPKKDAEVRDVLTEEMNALWQGIK